MSNKYSLYLNYKETAHLYLLKTAEWYEIKTTITYTMSIFMLNSIIYYARSRYSYRQRFEHGVEKQWQSSNGTLAIINIKRHQNTTKFVQVLSLETKLVINFKVLRKGGLSLDSNCQSRWGYLWVLFRL